MVAHPQYAKMQFDRQLASNHLCTLVGWGALIWCMLLGLRSGWLASCTDKLRYLQLSAQQSQHAIMHSLYRRQSAFITCSAANQIPTGRVNGPMAQWLSERYHTQSSSLWLLSAKFFIAKSCNWHGPNNIDILSLESMLKFHRRKSVA